MKFWRVLKACLQSGNPLTPQTRVSRRRDGARVEHGGTLKERPFGYSTRRAQTQNKPETSFWTLYQMCTARARRYVAETRRAHHAIPFI